MSFDFYEAAAQGDAITVAKMARQWPELVRLPNGSDLIQPSLPGSRWAISKATPDVDSTASDAQNIVQMYQDLKEHAEWVCPNKMALHYVVGSNLPSSPECVRVLLESKADVNAKTSEYPAVVITAGRGLGQVQHGGQTALTLALKALHRFRQVYHSIWCGSFRGSNPATCATFSPLEDFIARYESIVELLVAAGGTGVAPSEDYDGLSDWTGRQAEDLDADSMIEDGVAKHFFTTNDDRHSRSPASSKTVEQEPDAELRSGSPQSSSGTKPDSPDSPRTFSTSPRSSHSRRHRSKTPANQSTQAVLHTMQVIEQL